MTPKLVFNLLAAWERLVGPDNYSATSDLDRRKASLANEIQWFAEYADKREAPKGIVAANWNDADFYDAETKTRVTYPEKLQSRLCAIFEKLGVEIEWSDQVSSCNDCGRCIQTEPDSYSWQPDFIVGDGEILCAECTEDDAETLLEEAEGGTWNVESIDPADHGYELLPEEYTSGWFPGQTDDPDKVLKEFADRGMTRVIVVISEPSQFYTRWRVYKKIEDDDDDDDDDDEVSEEISP